MYVNSDSPKDVRWSAILNVDARSEQFKTRALTAVVIATNVAGNVLLSRGLHNIADVSSFNPSAFLQSIANPFVLIGVAILIVWMICDLALLSRADLSYVLPVTASAYVLIALFGEFVLGEHISPPRWAGIIAITLGVMLVGETAPRTTEEFDIGEEE